MYSISSCFYAVLINVLALEFHYVFVIVLLNKYFAFFCFTWKYFTYLAIFPTKMI